jgi:L-lactate utilization protein LutC
MVDPGTARDEMMGRLREKMRLAAHPAPWQSRRQFDDLARRFTAALTAAGGEVHRAADLSEALETLLALLRHLNARRIVANDEPPLSTLHSLISPEWHIVGKTPGDLRAFCATADVGLSGADAGLAESGTIVVSSGPGKSRLATLLPPIHVALLATNQLTADLFTWTAALRKHYPTSLPANAVLIGGPSKSADIERTLAVGVHGPKRLIVLLYGPGNEFPA